MSFAEGYVEVAQRLTQFFKKYPDGSIQTEPATVITIADRTFIAVIASAYRTADDVRPARGQAWEVYPGKTSYTRDSEAMNAETSAVGRALAFLGFETKKSVASANEVRARKPEKVVTVERHSSPPVSAPVAQGEERTAQPSSPAQPAAPAAKPNARMKLLFALMSGAGIGDDDRHGWAADTLGRPVASFSELDADDLSMLIDKLRPT